MTFAYTFDDIKGRPVAVIGAGTLGRRISMMMASQGGQVNIYDPNLESAQQACQFVLDEVPGVVKDRGFGSVGTPKAFSDEEKGMGDNRFDCSRGRNFRNKLFLVPIQAYCSFH